jgi:Cu2+-exporting ATPase/Cu+-exporting ATPase
VLQESGLGHYYELKRSGVCFAPPVPVASPSPISEPVLQNTETEVRFFIEGIHCSACLWLLERLPRLLPEAVRNCALNLSNSVLSVSLTDPARASDVAKTLRQWGYVPHLMRDREEADSRIREGNRRSLIELGIAGALMGNIMLMSIPLYAGVKGEFEALFEWACFILAIPSLFYSGRSFFRNVAAGIRTRTFPIDAPILLALLAAFFFSTDSLVRGTHQLYFDSLSALIFLLLGSRYYLARLRQNSTLGLGALQHLEVTTESKIGDRVHPGDGTVFGFDGVVRTGEGWCDTSRFTGESLPVHLTPGSPVTAGSLLISSRPGFSVEVTAVGPETRLSRLLERIREAQNRRTETELRSDRWARRLLMVVSAVALVSWIVFALQGRGPEGLVRVLALLIVTCPCALALATPLVFSLAMKHLLDRGLLVKDPSAIDRIPEIDRVSFDKTGTLTEGLLHTGFDPAGLAPDEAGVLFSLVSASRHPVARALERKLQEAGCRSVPVEEFLEVPGLGLRARALGSMFTLFRPQSNTASGTESVFSRDGVERIRIRFTDRTRSGSKQAVEDLKRLGWSTAIVSGDQAGAVSALAAELGVGEYHAGVSPEGKAIHSRSGLMIGDGVNDALALSAARVSVAVQGGMEAAVESAQAYSLIPGIHTLPELVRTGRRVRKVLRMNFCFSTAYNAVGGTLSLLGFMNPLLAAILMPLSALTVFWFSLSRMKARTP